MSQHLKPPTTVSPSGFRQRPGYRSATFLASVSVLAVILLLGLWVLLKPANNAAGGAIATVPGTSPGHTPNVSTPTGFGAPTSDVMGRREETPLNPAGAFLPQTDSPSTGDWSAPPAGLVWENVYGWPMAFSTSDGPTGITSDGIPVGFAHTPQGAALAATQYTARLMTAPAAQRQAMAATMFLAQTDAARQLLDQMVRSYISPDKAHSWYAITAGVKVTSYTGKDCQIHFASPVIKGQPVDALVDLAWRDGMWKIVIPDSPPLPNAQRTLASLDGWNTQW